MFPRIIFAFIFFLALQKTNAQFEISYRVEIVMNTGLKDVIDNKKAGHELWSKHLRTLENCEGILNVCANQSYFTIVNRGLNVNYSDYLSTAFFDTSSWLTTNDSAKNIRRRKQQIIYADYNRNPWVFTGEKREIAGYVCEKAYKKLFFETQPDLERLVVVWYTPDIPVDSGMLDANGIPGLILLYTNGKYKYIASSVKPVKNCEINVPEMSVVSFSEYNEAAAKRNKARVEPVIKK